MRTSYPFIVLAGDVFAVLQPGGIIRCRSRSRASRAFVEASYSDRFLESRRRVYEDGSSACRSLCEDLWARFRLPLTDLNQLS